MVDWKVVNVPAVLARKVRSFDAQGREIPDNGSWHRIASDMEYVLAEFFSAKGLIASDIDVTRRPDLEIRFSDLTAHGQAFVKSQAISKWQTSIDRQGMDKPITNEGLERRWRQFIKSHPQA